VTKRYRFCAAHRLHTDHLASDENQTVFGKCNNPNGHGHNYMFEVTLEGETDPVTGMVFDLRELKDIIQEEVVEPMDHRHLNKEVLPFDTVVPTTENIAAEIWRRLDPKLQRPHARLKNVRLYETADLFVDYGGPDAAH